MSSDSQEIEFPVMRYDITLPLLEGRVPIEGVRLKPVKASSMINKEDPKMMGGEFGVMDLHIGYFLPADLCGWPIAGLADFRQLQSAYQLVVCHPGIGLCVHTN